MNSVYNKIAGNNAERLAALSDGIFAFAMTLLVLDLRVPAAELIRTDHDLWRGLVALTPQIVMYMMSFVTLGIFWVGQQTQLNHLERSARSLSWMHLVFLLGVTLVPFSTHLLAEFNTYRVALIFYWLNILLLGGSLYLTWNCALSLNLMKADMPPESSRAIQHRIVSAQSLYAFGAALCIFNTHWSIGFIVLVQLYYGIAPRIGRRKD